MTIEQITGYIEPVLIAKNDKYFTTDKQLAEWRVGNHIQIEAIHLRSGQIVATNLTFQTRVSIPFCKVTGVLIGDWDMLGENHA